MAYPAWGEEESKKPPVAPPGKCLQRAPPARGAECRCELRMLLAGRGSAAAAVAALQALTFAQELRIVLLLLFFRRSLVFGRLRCPCALPNISASSAAFAAAREGLLSRSPPLPSPLSPLPSSLFSSPLAALSFRSPLFTSPPLPLFFSSFSPLPYSLFSSFLFPLLTPLTLLPSPVFPLT